MKTAIVGSKFRPGGVDAVARLRKGSHVLIVREADNPADGNAVAVHSTKGEHLGYVPKSLNSQLARDLDAGQIFVGMLTDEAIVQNSEIKFAPKISINRRPENA